jgi:hypothetical protein
MVGKSVVVWILCALCVALVVWVIYANHKD